MSEESLDVLANSERQDLVVFHFGLGMFIRNQWLYPHGSVLREKFIGIGVVHADDMSSIIIEALWLALNGLEINLSTLRELAGWSERLKDDRKEGVARLQGLIGTLESDS
jgi:hypothetical protein